MLKSHQDRKPNPRFELKAPNAGGLRFRLESVAATTAIPTSVKATKKLKRHFILNVVMLCATHAVNTHMHHGEAQSQSSVVLYMNLSYRLLIVPPLIR